MTAGFTRSLKKLAGKNPEIPEEVYQAILEVLQHDPFKHSRRHTIKKLTNVDVGQWRVRSGVYRRRFDVSGDAVVLHAINHRRDAY